MGTSVGSLADPHDSAPFAADDGEEVAELHGGLRSHGLAVQLPSDASGRARFGISGGNSSLADGLAGRQQRRPSTEMSAGVEDAVTRSGRVNPFMFDAEKLKHLSHESQARRLWREGNHIFSFSSVLQDLEHQWTSLSEPAVLPLTTPIPKRFKEMLKTSEQFGTWSLAVPMQEEVASGIPYARAMSADELLQELLCQRFEQDFQLLKYVKMSKQLSLQQEQTYYLSQGNQVHKITFMHEGSTLR